MYNFWFPIWLLMGQHKWIPIEHSEEGKNPSELIV